MVGYSCSDLIDVRINSDWIIVWKWTG